MKRILLFATMATALEGIQEVKKPEAVIPVESVIRIPMHQVLYKLDLLTFWVEKMPAHKLHYDLQGWYFRIDDMETNCLYYPAHNVSQAIRHFQKKLNKFYQVKHHMGPFIEISQKPNDSSTGAVQPDIIPDPGSG